jgi:ribosome-binding protein aMBF1 (putative translation factor)
MRHAAEAGADFWGWCDYCGGPIDLGESYYEYSGMRVCAECAR